MADYWFRVNDVMYFLDSVESISYTESGDLTSIPIESGKRVADHYVDNPERVEIRGVISDIKSIKNIDGLNTTNFLDGLFRARQNKSSVFLKYRTDKEEVGDFYIVDISHTQNAGKGPVRSANGVINAYTVSISFKKSLRGKAADFDVKPPQAFLDFLEEKRRKEANARRLAASAKKLAELDNLISQNMQSIL